MQTDGQDDIRQVFQRHQAFLEAQSFPDFLPKGYAAFPVDEIVRTAFEQTIHGLRDVGWGDLKFLADPMRLWRGEIGSDLNRIEPAVPPGELFVGKVVVYVGQMNMKNLVPQKCEAFQGIEGIQNDEAANVEMTLDRRPRAVQSG